MIGCPAYWKCSRTGWAGRSCLSSFARASCRTRRGDPWDGRLCGRGRGGLFLVAACRAIGGRAIAGGMSFDSLAAHYRWMEWLLAGRKLQRCRTAFLRRIHPPREVLLVGEGNGRFLEALLQAYPQARVTCVDASAAMLKKHARARLAAGGGDLSGVSFVHSDIFSWAAPRNKFDLVASHFFLDCFRPEEVDRIIDRIAAAAFPNAQWLLADFREPAAGPRAGARVSFCGPCTLSFGASPACPVHESRRRQNLSNTAAFACARKSSPSGGCCTAIGGREKNRRHCRIKIDHLNRVPDCTTNISSKLMLTLESHRPFSLTEASTTMRSHSITQIDCQAAETLRGSGLLAYFVDSMSGRQGNPTQEASR